MTIFINFIINNVRGRKAPKELDMKNYKVVINVKETVKSADRDTFYKDSRAEFVMVEKPETKPDYVSDSGSQYWYTPEGVIRFSDHWMSVASCWWIVKDHVTSTLECAGFCRWEDFERSVWTEREEIVHNKKLTKAGSLACGGWVARFVGEVE